MEEITFNSLEELYERLKPALKTKKEEFNLQSYDFITESNIWYYLTKTKWVNSKGLSLSKMVDDIMTCSALEIVNYLDK